VFDREFLHEQLRRDAADRTSSRDFGRDIIPWVVANGRAIAHRFAESCVKSRAEGGDYWRVSEKRHPGWSRVYARVLATGSIRQGDPVRLLSAAEVAEVTAASSR